VAPLSQTRHQMVPPVSADNLGAVSAPVVATTGRSTLLRPAVALLAKELRTEFRTRELLATTLVFVLMVLVLFSFTFDPTAAETRRFAPGLLWLALLFAGSLMLHPSFTREQANDTLAALRLAPIEPVAILAAKIAANLCFLLVAELMLLPIFAALYNLSLLPVLGRLVVVLFWGTLGLATIGTVFSAVSAQARMRELLLPLLLLPLMAPALIASAEATVGLFDDPAALSPVWTTFLAAFDVMFLTVTWLFGEYLLEE
jgi:heme exporter protein B